MKIPIGLLIAIFVSVGLLAPVAEAKRAAPPAVTPVHSKGVTYSAPPFLPADAGSQNGGVVEARDAHGALLWRVTVYHTAYQAGLEKDVQDVFIKSLSLDESLGFLLLSDEADRVFAVDLLSRKVTRLR